MRILFFTTDFSDFIQICGEVTLEEWHAEALLPRTEALVLQEYAKPD